MTSVGLFEAKLEAFEMRMDAKLRALFEEFRLGRSPSPIRSQRGANSDGKKNPLEIRSEDRTRQRYSATTSISFTQLQEWSLNQDEEVKARQPYTLKAAISFAQHQEKRLNHKARSTRVAPRPAATKLSPPPTASQPPQPKKLTRENLHDGSAKGLCGYCDKLWSLEHQCKKETPLMIAPTEELKLEDMTLEPKVKDTPQPATRTVLTLAGYTNLQKLKIEGFLEQ
ncbi:hypothetical protein BHM03_00006175 [Ensete ventricosum]|nr:hypothetical protein BHM03_00006175 [Ensete ventricosum]